MHQGLRGDHAVQELPPGIPGQRDYRPIDVRSGGIERQGWNGSQDCIEPRPPNGGKFGRSIDASLEFYAGDHGYQHRIVQRRDLGHDGLVAIPQVDRDIGVDQIRHP